MKTAIVVVSLALWLPVAGAATASRTMLDALAGGDVIDVPPERISLTLHTPGGDDVVIWNWLAGTFTPVAPSPSHEGHATWSPDGSWLAFETTRDGDWEIYLIRPDCLRPRSNCPDELHNLTLDPGEDLYPNWSPDGRVVHFSDRSSYYDIWLTPIDGSPPLNLTDDPGDDLHPNFSPRGDAFVMRADRPADPEIWRMDLATGELVNLTATPGTDRYPNYSPDGSRVLFVSDRTNNEEIWVMREDGSGQTNLTRHPARDYHASWSPDGRHILFISDRASRGDLYLMEVETGEVHLLLDLEVPIDWPFWAPTSLSERKIKLLPR